ncbi:Thiaminase-2 [Legionella nautarum]|uniref:Thiaminase-2 n=1 Tax=Legionella nautarum TaxID=45070 RepID=A0A0W0WP07_9GAMM|nr:TenA family protein [Legionella nautarum]KTD34045.1 Thiaminase-2 [Legionella nautarum]
MRARDVRFFSTSKFLPHSQSPVHFKLADVLKPSVPLISEVVHHPFNLGVKKGNLPILVFKKYLEQDKHYLQKFAKSLHIISERLHEQNHQQRFKTFSEEIIETEQELHEKYLKKLLPHSLFNRSKTTTIEELPVVGSYTSYLFGQAEKEPVEEAVASHLSCFYVYMKLGEEIKAVHCLRDNRYWEWIRSYSSANFRLSTQQMLSIFEELIAPIQCPEKQAKISLAFLNAVEFEHAFFDAVYPKNNISCPATFTAKYR